MRTLNKWEGIGNLGADPEVRQAGQDQVANFRMACTEKWKDAQGQQKEHTEWVSVVAWKGLATIVQQYLRKGQQVFVTGKLRTRSWDDQSGQKRYTTEVVADDLMLLGHREGAGQQQGGGFGGQQQGYAPPQGGPAGAADPTDLPF